MRGTGATRPALPAGAWGLLGLGAAGLALTAWQWRALVRLEGEGVRPACSLSEALDCGAVWTSPLAQTVHRFTGLPLAGWGLVWSAALLLLALALLRPAWRGPAVAGLRLLGAAGALGSLLLAGYSAWLGTWCLSCIAFYAIAAGAAWLAWRLPLPAAPWRAGASAAGGALGLGLLLALWPALHTPRPAALPGGAAGEMSLEAFLQAQRPEVRQLISDLLAAYRRAPRRPYQVDRDRLLFGPPEAPVLLEDWIEIRCPHCRNLDAALRQIRRIAPAGSWAEEGRHFPLDHRCNPHVPRSHDGTSCLAARLLICLTREDPEEADRVREALFARQERLDRALVWSTTLALAGEEARPRLEACVRAPDTQRRLGEDIEEAMAYGIEGTPLVVVNGRRALHYPPFLLALILARGDPEHPAFRTLPPPRPLPRR